MCYECEDLFVVGLFVDVSDYEKGCISFVFMEYVFCGFKEVELAFEAVDTSYDSDYYSGCVRELLFEYFYRKVLIFSFVLLSCFLSFDTLLFN